MARVPLVQDDDEATRATGIFDTFRDEGRHPSDIFRALANVPGLMMAHRALGVEVEADHQRHLIDWAPTMHPVRQEEWQ